MIEKLHLTTIIFVAAVVWGILLIIDGVAVHISWLTHLSKVTGIVLILLTAFDRFLWRLTIFRSWFVSRPVIDGTWKVELRSNWINPSTGQGIAPIDGFMVARQTFSRLSLRLITRESQSELLGAEILRADDGGYRLFGVYRNEPRLSLREQSPIHYGGMVLQVNGVPPDKLSGHYWTDRQTAGELILSDRRAGHADDIGAGEKLYAAPRKRRRRHSTD